MKILTYIDCYLPGFRAGGPVRSVSGLVEALSDEFEFRVVTRDRDHTETRPYADVDPDRWTKVGRAQVLYLRPGGITIPRLAAIGRECDPDVVYINSLFSRMSARCLTARRLGVMPRVPFIVAPRGELSPGALRIKSAKKRTFLAVARSVGMLRQLVWQATAELERSEILRVLGPRATVVVAPNLAVGKASDAGATAERASRRSQKHAGFAEFVFVSRVSRKKNLAFAIRALAGVKGRASLDIYGPIDDQGYWRECQRTIDALPPSVTVRYHGALMHEQVTAAFAAGHFFLFPTQGENFGHAIHEALGASCPVVLSERTPWSDVERLGAGWIVPLAQEGRWCEVLQACVDMPGEAYETMARNGPLAVSAFEAHGNAVDLSERMFRDAVTGREQQIGA